MKTPSLLLASLAATMTVACGSESPAAPTPPTPSPSAPIPMQVEPSNRNTFGPGPSVVVPPGTRVFLRIQALGRPSPILLNQCGEPCNTASVVRRWEPESMRVGDTLSHQLPDSGRYYLWLRDDQGGGVFASTSDSLLTDARRMTFANDAVIDGWYILP